MLIKRPSDIRSSEITAKSVYVNRRAFLRAATASLGVVVAQCGGGSPPQAPPAAATPSQVPPAAAAPPGAPPPLRPEAGAPAASPVPALVPPQPSAISGRKLLNVKTGSSFSTAEKVNTWQQITSYNNFYEFGIDKESPSRYAHSLKTSPWSIAVEGECARPAVWHLEDVLKGETFEERIYRLRCVEGWSMVVPWVGFPLSDFIRKVQPTGKAKFVEFTTLGDPEQMPGLRAPYLRWPYVEGLRMDEAMHPLAILAIGLYDEVLPNQNGAPIRLVVPWKYGFKNVKSIVRIRFVEEQPLNSWQLAAPREYGFYANVNPTVDHPRWSQSHEVRLPGLFKSRPTEMFNGYGEQVAGLYGGMDLRVNF